MKFHKMTVMKLRIPTPPVATARRRRRTRRKGVYTKKKYVFIIILSHEIDSVLQMTGYLIYSPIIATFRFTSEDDKNRSKLTFMRCIPIPFEFWLTEFSFFKINHIGKAVILLNIFIWKSSWARYLRRFFLCKNKFTRVLSKFAFP